jgi:transposase InsO family protein
MKIHKRLKNKGLNIGKNRVYRLMKAEGLLLKTPPKNGSSGIHDGTITTLIPNQMWATDGKEFRTEEDGKCWFMGVIDHFNDEILSFHLSTTFDAYAAMEPLRMAVRNVFGSVSKGICKGMELTLRADHGSQYDSDKFQDEVAFLGLDYSPSFVRSPECNGVIERFHRTLNEQVFNIQTFKNIDEAQKAIADFIVRYNKSWILHRLSLKSPIEYRLEFEQSITGKQ